MTLALTCLALGLSVAATAAAIPERILPRGVGVNIHFNRGHEAELDLIAAAGFKWIRMDLGWAGIERKRGEYDWSAYDELTANLARRGLSAIYILDYSNPLYETPVTARNPVSGESHTDIASPQHPESVAAFARWAAAAAAHFKGRPIIWEIWNEPNITFWKPKPDVHQYAELALATCQAVRKADPKAIILAPATSEIPLKFLEDFFATGVLAHLDGVSVHPYRSYQKAPETALDDYRKLRELIERHAPPAKRQMPIISGEWGYASHVKGISLETQADFLVRQQLANLLAGIPISIWYDWKNDGPDPNEREHNFGTVTSDLKPKPAYLALQTMTGELSGYRVLRRLPAGTDQDYLLEFTAPRRPPKLAAWTLGPIHEAALPAKVGGTGAVRAVSSQGERFGVEQVRNGRSAGAMSTQSIAPSGSAVRLDRAGLVIRLSPAPLYLTLNGVKLR